MRHLKKMDKSKLLGFNEVGDALFNTVQTTGVDKAAEASAAGDVKLVGRIKPLSNASAVGIIKG